MHVTFLLTGLAEHLQLMSLQQHPLQPQQHVMALLIVKLHTSREHQLPLAVMVVHKVGTGK